MMTAAGTTPDPWGVLDYEVDMFQSLCGLLQDGNPEFRGFSHHVQNAVVESTLLHARILVDVLLSWGRDSDDIRLTDLLPGLELESVELLRQAYGNRKRVGSPCWTLNKMLAHPTLLRGTSYDYSGMLNQLRPFIGAVLHEVDGHRGNAA